MTEEEKKQEERYTDGTIILFLIPWYFSVKNPGIKEQYYRPVCLLVSFIFVIPTPLLNFNDLLVLIQSKRKWNGLFIYIARRDTIQDTGIIEAFIDVTETPLVSHGLYNCVCVHVCVYIIQSTQRPRIISHLEVVRLCHQHQRLGCRPQHGVKALTSAVLVQGRLYWSAMEV